MKQSALNSFKVYKYNFKFIVSSDVGIKLPHGYVIGTQTSAIKIMFLFFCWNL